MRDKRTTKGKTTRKHRTTRTQTRKKAGAVKRKPSPARLQRLNRAQKLADDMLRDPSLVFTRTARKRGLDPRWVLKHLGSMFRKDSSGRIRAKSRRPRHMTLYIPSASPGISIPVVTKNVRERKMLGEWMAALNAAGHADFSRIRKFPRRQVVGGVPLPTDLNEIQNILIALAEEEFPFEGLYRTLVRPS